VKRITESELEEIIKLLENKYKSDFSFLKKFKIFKNSENKFFIFSGEEITSGERYGLEAFKLENNKVRLNFHFANLFKEKIKDFFIEVDEKVAKKFIQGQDIKKEDLDLIFKDLLDQEFYLLKFKGFFIGNVKVIKRENLLKNYLAKQYRFKNIEL